MADDPNGNGSDNPNGDDAPQYVTPDQLNGAITGHLRRLEQKLEQREQALIEKLAEQFKPKPRDDDDDDDMPPGKGGDDDIAAKMQKKFERQLAEERKRIERLEQEREAERSKSRDMQLRQSVRDALSEAGIEGTRLKAAMALIIDGEKRVSLADDGKVQFVDHDGVRVGLKEGISEWSKTDDAKVFLPPIGAQGSGERPRSGGSMPQGDDAKSALKALIGRKIQGG